MEENWFNTLDQVHISVVFIAIFLGVFVGVVWRRITDSGYIKAKHEEAKKKQIGL